MLKITYGARLHRPVWPVGKLQRSPNYPTRCSLYRFALKVSRSTSHKKKYVRYALKLPWLPHAVLGQVSTSHPSLNIVLDCTEVVRQLEGIVVTPLVFFKSYQHRGLQPSFDPCLMRICCVKSNHLLYNITCVGTDLISKLTIRTDSGVTQGEKKAFASPQVKEAF